MMAKSLIEVNPLQVTSLYTRKMETKIEGLNVGPSGSNLEFYQDEEISWKVKVKEDGFYEVFLCVSTKFSGITCLVEANGEQACGELQEVNGFFEGYPLMNYVRISITGQILLLTGENTIRLRMQGVESERQAHLSSIELVPLKAKKEIEAINEKVISQRANTDWMVASRYGIMFHWTSQSQPRHGSKLSYSDAVQNFDVENFSQMVEETGAGFVIFTLNHADPHCPAPIRSWEEVHPGWTTERDLIREIGEALRAKGIRLMIYIASHSMGDLFEVNRDQYVERHENLLTEIGQRYGDLLWGYWFDGWYQAYERFAHFPLERVYQASKAGNQDRLVAFNFWIYPSSVPYQEYWSGEVASPGKLPTERIFEEGAGKGLQYQALLIMDAPWVHSEVETEMADPRFSAEELNLYINKCSEKEGVVTINLGIYQDGSIGEKTLGVMKELKALQRN